MNKGLDDRPVYDHIFRPPLVAADTEIGASCSSIVHDCVSGLCEAAPGSPRLPGGGFVLGFAPHCQRALSPARAAVSVRPVRSARWRQTPQNMESAGIK